jgi:hypothetical protein
VGAKLGEPRGPYWTRRMQRELELREVEQERLKEQHRIKRADAAKERNRTRSREWARRIRQTLKAAGLPCPHGGKEPPKASTPRMRRWRERQRVLREAWDAALKENRRRDRRIARGLPPMPKTSTQRAQESRERKAAQRADYLANQWWSPALSETDAKAILQNQQPGVDESRIQTNYVCLKAQADGARLNLNAFVIAENGDGIQKGVEQRAIFNEVYRQLGTVDLLAVLKQAESVPDLRSVIPQLSGRSGDETWNRNVMQKAIDRGATMWGRGDLILKAAREEKWTIKRQHTH